MFLCIFAHPKSIPGSLEVLLGLWGLGSAATAGSQGGSWPWNWKTKRVWVGLRLLCLCPLWSSPCVPKAQGRSCECPLCFLWPLAAHLGDFHPFQGLQEAAPKACSAWNVGTALGLPLFWVIPGNAAAAALPVELRDGNSLDCSPAPRAAL